MDGVDNSITRRRPQGRTAGAEPVVTPRPDEPSTHSGPSLGRSGDDGADGARGSDLARAALEAARASAKANGRAGGRAGTVRRTPGAVRTSRRRRGWSGPGTDDRDPQALGRLASRLIAERGWGARIAGGVVFARWAQLVGDDVAEHAAPVALRDGELTVQASSTAWATQLRLLQRQLLGRITAAAGKGVVTRLRVQGPAGPSWKHGTRTVRGRGPRDTYG